MAQADRIAFVCPRFPQGPTVGGAETLLKCQAGRLAAAGRQVTFLTTCATDHFTWANEIPPGTRSFDGVEVMFFPVDEDRDLEAFFRAQNRISRGGPVSPHDEQAWLNHNVNSRPLLRHLETHGGHYDTIVVGPYLFSLTVSAASLFPGKTVLVPCLHNEPFARLEIFRRIFSDVRGCMFNTAPERALAARLYGSHCLQFPVVGMGIEPFDVDASAFAGKTGLARPYVVYSGRREPLKGTPLLIDYVWAFRRRTNRDLALVFTGTGPIELLPGKSSHIIDLGFVTENEKREAMAGAVAFCHPSVNESLGIVALEAWLSGTPVLAHDRCEVLRHHCRQSGGGLWFRNYPEFEEELVMLLDDGQLRNALAKAGRSYVVKEYAWEAVEPRLVAAVDGLAFSR